MKKRNKILIAALILIIITAVTFTASDTPVQIGSVQEDTVILYGGQANATVNGETVWLDGEIIDVNSCVYVAPERLLLACGFGLGWADDIKAVIAVRGDETSYIVSNSPVLWKGPQRYQSLQNTIVYKGVFYIPLDMFEVLTDSKISIEGEAAPVKYMKRDLLTDTYVDDTYRLSGSAANYGNVYVAGNFGMERLLIPNDAAKDYAGAVNQIAANLPEQVNVFDIVIPTAAEFYGPQNVYTNQTAGIRTVYENLSERVTPVNAVRPLYNHAGENIYFRTDHHWTQRGAYYVYREFMEIKGETVPPLSEFPVRYGNYAGSLAGFAKGTYGETILRANPDCMERFLAPHYTAGAAYGDMYMKNYTRSLSAVYGDTNSYMAFIGGDNPLSVFTTDVGNGKKIVIMKESFGNAFATWALNNYSEVYVIDIREFNSSGKSRFNLREFYDFVHFDDLVVISYPVSVASSAMRGYLRGFIN